MRKNFWQKFQPKADQPLAEKRPFTVLAPMANVTDWAFRQIIIDTGRPDVFFTEFISADGIRAVGPEKFKGELFFEENERPIVAQFFTAKPENMYMCAQLAQELGFDGVDINMGCPDKSVEKQGAGAALMKNPELAKKIIKEAVRGSGALPVSVKTRLGFNKIDHDWIRHLLGTEISALAVHLRTRKEMSKVPAHWDGMGEISKIAHSMDPSKLIIGNGDVKNMSDLNSKAKLYDLDGVMVGRGIFENPWFFAGKEVSDPHERIRLLLKHVKNYEKLWGENKRFDYMKRFFKIYISNWGGAKILREKLMKAKNFRDVDEIIKTFVI